MCGTLATWSFGRSLSLPKGRPHPIIPGSPCSHSGLDPESPEPPVAKPPPLAHEPRRSPLAANDCLRFRRCSLPSHRLQGSPLKARDPGPAGGVRFRVNLRDNWVAVWQGVFFLLYSHWLRNNLGHKAITTFKNDIFT